MWRWLSLDVLPAELDRELHWKSKWCSLIFGQTLMEVISQDVSCDSNGKKMPLIDLMVDAVYDMTVYLPDTPYTLISSKQIDSVEKYLMRWCDGLREKYPSPILVRAKTCVRDAWYEVYNEYHMEYSPESKLCTMDYTFNRDLFVKVAAVVVGRLDSMKGKSFEDAYKLALSEMNGLIQWRNGIRRDGSRPWMNLHYLPCPACSLFYVEYCISNAIDKTSSEVQFALSDSLLSSEDISMPRYKNRVLALCEELW
jgi:hypothetical protein